MGRAAEHFAAAAYGRLPSRDGNGEMFSMADLWPAFSNQLGMPMGEDRTFSFLDELPRRAGAWNTIRALNGLIAPDVGAFLGRSMQFADWVFAFGKRRRTWHHLRRQAAPSRLHETMYSDEMFAKWFGRYRQARLLPPG